MQRLIEGVHRFHQDEFGQENTLFALENLQAYPCVQARLADGSLHVHAWFFKTATAELYACDPESKQFEPLAGVSPPKP